MKKMTYFVMALALVLGFTQCKKEQTPANNETEGVFITLDVNGGNNGSRVIVDPTGNNGVFNYATVTFEDRDVIYVGYKGAYVGQLTYNGVSFSGTIDATPDMENKEPLHFYFLGGKGFNATVDETDKTATVNISSQALKLPVISYAPSNDDFTGAGTYSATLMNKCSIMKFNVTKPAESISAVCISGMNNKVTVHFDTPDADDNGFSYSKDGSGQIMMQGGTGESIDTWAIVLPQEALAVGTTGSAYINDYEGTRPAIGVIGSNQYISDATNRTIAIGSTHTGMLIGEFKVDDNKYVHFSQGNLQYQASTDTWRFAINQYDFVGDETHGNVYVNDVKCNNENISPSYAGWIDLLGWGTDFGGTLNGHGDWFTLSDDEWLYIFGHSTKGWSTVDGVNGYVLRPDGNTTAVASSYTAEAWAVEEASGSVFLPAAGLRDGTDVGLAGEYGYCWSSTAYDDTSAWFVYFGESSVDRVYDSRSYGMSVRLVR